MISYTSHRGLEQLVARRAHNTKVVGSSPSPATIAVVQKNGCFFVMSEIPQKAVVGPEEGYEPLGE